MPLSPHCFLERWERLASLERTRGRSLGTEIQMGMGELVFIFFFLVFRAVI